MVCFFVVTQQYITGQTISEDDAKSDVGIHSLCSGVVVVVVVHWLVVVVVCFLLPPCLRHDVMIEIC